MDLTEDIIKKFAEYKIDEYVLHCDGIDITFDIQAEIVTVYIEQIQTIINSLNEIQDIYRILTKRELPILQVYELLALNLQV